MYHIYTTEGQLLGYWCSRLPRGLASGQPWERIALPPDIKITDNIGPNSTHKIKTVVLEAGNIRVVTPSGVIKEKVLIVQEAKVPEEFWSIPQVVRFSHFSKEYGTPQFEAQSK